MIIKVHHDEYTYMPHNRKTRIRELCELWNEAVLNGVISVDQLTQMIIYDEVKVKQ